MIIFEKHGLENEEFFRAFPFTICEFPQHFHRAFELIFVIKGEISVSIDLKDYTLHENDLAFIFSNQLHEIKSAHSSKITIVLFSPELLRDFFAQYKDVVPDNNILHLNKIPDIMTADSIYRQKSLLYGICDELIRHKSFEPIKRSPQTKLLYKILIYIEQNYSKDITLKDVAKYLQYDYPYISKLFVKLMDMSFTDYLNHYRISQASYLLRNYDLLVGEVAAKCGYSNLRTFHRNFRKLTGKSPKEYKQYIHL